MLILIITIDNSVLYTTHSVVILISTRMNLWKIIYVHVGVSLPPPPPPPVLESSHETADSAE
jgi:hypothetical protein